MPRGREAFAHGGHLERKGFVDHIRLCLQLLHTKNSTIQIIPEVSRTPAFCLSIHRVLFFYCCDETKATYRKEGLEGAYKFQRVSPWPPHLGAWRQADAGAAAESSCLIHKRERKRPWGRWGLLKPIQSLLPVTHLLEGHTPNPFQTVPPVDRERCRGSQKHSNI